MAEGGRRRQSHPGRTIRTWSRISQSAILALDALHTWTITAAQIRAAGAHCVLTVKGNQKSLYSALKKLPWAKIPATSTTQRGHGHLVVVPSSMSSGRSWSSATRSWGRFRLRARDRSSR